MIQHMNNCENRGALLKKEEIERDRENEGREGGQTSRGALALHCDGQRIQF